MEKLSFVQSAVIPRTFMVLTAAGLALFLSTAVTAQAPRRAPAPGSLWAYPTGHVQKVSPHELWGDVYCSGGTICHHGCGCGLLHHVGRTVLRTLDCLLPCHHCGATSPCGCTGRAPMRVAHGCRSCCIPSVRFCKPTPGCGHRVGCGCAGHPTVIEETPVLVQPPVPQPETAPKPQESAQVKRRATHTTIASRISQPASLKSKPATQTASPLQPVSYEQPAKKQSDDLPVNPLRQPTRR